MNTTRFGAAIKCNNAGCAYLETGSNSEALMLFDYAHRLFNTDPFQEQHDDAPSQLFKQVDVLLQHAKVKLYHNEDSATLAPPGMKQDKQGSMIIDNIDQEEEPSLLEENKVGSLLMFQSAMAIPTIVLTDLFSIGHENVTTYWSLRSCEAVVMYNAALALHRRIVIDDDNKSLDSSMSSSSSSSLQQAIRLYRALYNTLKSEEDAYINCDASVDDSLTMEEEDEQYDEHALRRLLMMAVLNNVGCIYHNQKFDYRLSKQFFKELLNTLTSSICEGDNIPDQHVDFFLNNATQVF